MKHKKKKKKSLRNHRFSAGLGERKVNELVQILSMLEAKFGDDPLDASVILKTILTLNEIFEVKVDT